MLVPLLSMRSFSFGLKRTTAAVVRPPLICHDPLAGQSGRRGSAERAPAWSVFAVALLALAGCTKGPVRVAPGGAGGAGGAASAPEVAVLTVAPEAVSLSRELPGRTSAYRVAEVRARISGIVQKRHFVEGADVKEGELLFEIDPAPYEAVLESAKATLARAEASLASSAAQAERYRGLVATNAISRQAYDDAVAAHRAHEAEVLAGRAAVRSAEINLGYTRVVSPITGRIGRAAVTEGAYVQQATATLLATVQQLDPLYVDLNQTAEEVLQLKQSLSSGRLEKSAEGGARLSLTLANGFDYAQAGSLQFSDVSVNMGTGTVVLRGVVPNPKGDLLPGLFLKARIEVGRDPAALLVPQSAVRRTARGEGTVFVVGAGDKAELRVIETGETVGNRWLVQSGLKPGDQVILDNLQKIRPGAPVRPVKSGAVPPAKAPESAR